MMKTYDVAIVGAGTMGAAGAYFCQQKGLDVLLIDAHTPPHEEGSHHGASRLFRYIYHNDAYQQLLNRAAYLWAYLEEKHDVHLLNRCGVINIAPHDHVTLHSKRNMADIYGLPYEWIDSTAIQKRWPGFSLRENDAGLFEPEAGYLHSERCIALFLRACGAVDTLFNQPVKQITQEDKDIVIHCADSHFRARRVVISAGTWAQHIAGLNIALPYTALRKTFAWYAAPTLYQERQGFPGFTVVSDAGIYYGFPDNGEGLKVGRHDGGEAMRDATERFAYGHYVRDQQDTDAFLKQFLPQVGALRAGKVCSYDSTADEDFIISLLPEDERLLLLSGFSGHGFKFAPAMGEIVADFASGKGLSSTLLPFSL
ncbi:MAG: N-methyl-L-tryptophan oxidase [Cardiobacteriaceae bacterium]|nr:N-methyl-L-tryptophan oxidase [Cardiobacteriaceae bacterium]